MNGLFRKIRGPMGVLLVLLLLLNMLPLNARAAPTLGIDEPLSILGSISSNNDLAPLNTDIKTGGEPSKVSQLLAYAGSVGTVTQASNLDAPILDALEPLTNKDQLTVSGISVAGATISLDMSKDGGDPTAVGSATADTQGRFAIPVKVPGSGSYSFTAESELSGTASLKSTPVTTNVDLMPPGKVSQLQASNPAYNSIALQWNPPADTDINKYYIDRDGNLIATVPTPGYTDTGLKEEAAYCYKVTAVDKAGNQSEAAQLCTGTLPSDKLTDLNQWYHNYYNLHHEFAMSRDGSTVAYRDVGDSGDAAWISYVHYLDISTGENKVINPDANSDSYDLTVNANGQVIAFNSYVQDLRSYDLYVYDRSNKTTTDIKTDSIISPSDDCISPSISADGAKIAFECGQNDLYLYEEKTKQMTLLDQMDSQHYSNNPLISDDGSTVIFYKTFWENNKETDFIVIYDVASGQVVHQVKVDKLESINLNANGMFIAYNAAGQLHVYDRAQDKVIDIANPNNYQYDSVALSSDGRYVLASYSHNPTPEEMRSHGVALIDATTNNIVRTIGSPAIDTLYPSMDGKGDKIVFEENNALYMECTSAGGCIQTPPAADPIDTVSWSVPDNQEIAGEIMPGAHLTIHAAGLSGQQLQADVTYMTKNGGDPQQATVSLTEDADVPGSYSGIFPIPDGTTVITALQAELTDHSFSKPADKRIPVSIGGNLQVTIHTEHPVALSGLTLTVSSRNVHMQDQMISLTGGVTQYTLSLPQGTDYTVQLKKGNELIVQKENVTVTSGQTLPVNLSPVFPASLTVKVANIISNKLPHVIFTDVDSGKQLGDVVVSPTGTSGIYTAVLSGQKEGQRVKVQLEGDPVYFFPDPQEMTLLPWDNQLNMQLEYESTIVRAVQYHYTKYNTGYQMLPIDGGINFEVWAKAGSTILVEVHEHERDSKGQVNTNVYKVNLSEGGVSPEAGYSVYSGTFQVHPGVTSVDSFTINVNGEEMPSVHPLQLSVMGQLTLSIQSVLKEEQPSWKGLTMAVLDSNSNYYTYPQTINGNGVYKFDLPGNHTFKVAAYYNGIEFTRTEPFSIENGNVVDRSLTPSFPAVLSGMAIDQDGNPIAHASLTLLAADGRELSRTVSSNDGTFILPGAMTGSTVTLKAVDSSANKGTVVKTITMSTDSAKTETIVKMTDYPKGSVTGKVLNGNGQPVAGVRVVAEFVHDGMVIPYTSQTDSHGQYFIAMPEGTVTVHSESDILTYSSPSTGQIQEGKALKLDLTLIRHVASIHVNLYSKYIGGTWVGPIGLDWRVSVHFGLYADHPVVTLGNPLEVRANPGDTVKVCVNGAEGDLPSDCQKVTIDANRQGNVEFRLQQEGGRAYGTIDGSDGGFRATFYHLNSKGLTDDSQWISRNNSAAFDVQLRKSGTYKVYITDTKGRFGLWKTFELTDGQMLNLGNLHLESLGLFDGQSGNGIRTMPDRLSPGGKAEVDVSYANNSGQARTVNEASVRIAIPHGLSFVEHSLSVNGQAMEAVISNGILTVPVGNSGVVSRGESGHIQFQVKADKQAIEAPVYLVASIDYTDASVAKEENLGTAEIDQTVITLEAPPYLTSLVVPLSGIAPAGSSVTVYDGQTKVGQTTASSVGYWTLEAHLPETAYAGDYHHLRAETVSGGNHISSDDMSVRFDADRAELTSVTMSQPDGRVVTFDPSKGVARFPYVYIGGGFIFKLHFKDPERITHVRVYMNGAMADATNHNGIFEAYVNPREPGPIWVDYDVLPDPNAVYVVPNHQQVIDRLPPEWRDYNITKLSLPSDNGTAGTNEPSLSLEADLTSDIHASVNYRFSKTDYTPTATDLERVQAYGEPIYGVEYGQQLQGDTLIYTISGYIPEDALPKGANDSLLQILAGASGKSLASNGQMSKQVKISVLPSKTFVKVTGEFVLHFGEINGKELWDLYGYYGKLKTVMDALEQSAFTRLNPLLDTADSLCNEELRKYYRDRINSLVPDIAGTMIAQRLIDIAGDAIKVDSLGLTVAVGFTLNKAGDMVGDVLNDDINEVTEGLMHAKEFCGNGPPLKSWPEHAKPVFIRDPSGLVYEGIPSNRLSGATATAMVWDSTTSKWMVWDASWFEQENPMETDAHGQYGWFVPDGTWKVRFTKDGYISTESSSMDVPPPRMNVNVGMVSYEAPVVSAERVAPGGDNLKISFSKPMLIDSFRNGGLIVTDLDDTNKTVTGSVYGIDTEKTADNSDAAMSVVFKPDTALTVGHTYRITVTQEATDYAHVGLSEDDVRNETILSKDLTPPGDPGNPAAYANESQLALTWTDPSDLDTDKIRITWKKEGSAEAPSQLEVAKGVQWAELDDLEAGTGYEITLAAVDEAGNLSAGTTLKANTFGNEVTAPLNVSALNVTPSPTTVKLTWTDPLEGEMSKVVIKWQQKGGVGMAYSGDALKGEQAYTITGLNSDTTYQITVTAVDTDGRQSLTQTLNVRTLKSHSSGSGSEPDKSNEKTVYLTAGSGEAAFFDNRLIMSYGIQTFANNTELKLREDEPGTTALDSHYSQLSNTFTLSGSNTLQITQPFTISIAWNSSELKQADPRRLGIYRQNLLDPSQWVYVGGILIDGENRIEANIDQLGTYAVLLYDHPFQDLKGNWSQQVVDVMVSRHILHGVNDAKFEPNRPITRAEMVTLLIHSLNMAETKVTGGTGQAGNKFVDVPKDAWYAKNADEASRLGLVRGYGGLFRPYDTLTREEMVILMDRFYHLQTASSTGPSKTDLSVLHRFKDIGTLSEEAKQAFSEAVTQGWIIGETKDTMVPEGTATRAQAAVVMLRVLTSLGQVVKSR
jgi:chitodextrinase